MSSIHHHPWIDGWMKHVSTIFTEILKYCKKTTETESETVDILCVGDLTNVPIVFYY